MIHNLIGITGRFGSGKSLYAVEWGLKLANAFEKNLVVNFPLNVKWVKRYCKVQGLKWFLANGRVIQIELYDNLMDLWHFPIRNGYILNRDTVTIFDEGGVMANSRAWASIPKEFMKYLFQLRKLNVHLLLVFQFEEQVDKQFRLVIQRWLVCKAFGYYDKTLKKPRILQRVIYHYDPEKFMRLQENTQARGNPVLPWLWSERVDFSFAWVDYLIYGLIEFFVKLLSFFGISRPIPLSPLALLFKCFDSGALVGGLAKSPSRPAKQFSDSDYFRWLHSRNGSFSSYSRPSFRHR